MRCPYCGGRDTKVLESRAVDERSAVRRRRECEACSRRFTTYERWEEGPLVVIKKDGRREAFSRQKVLAGLLKACEKRAIPTEQLEDIAEAIERELRHRGETEVTSRRIGERVMDRLRELDEVAYVRFASVYREFRDLDSFMRELERLLRPPGGSGPQAEDRGEASGERGRDGDGEGGPGGTVHGGRGGERDVGLGGAGGEGVAGGRHGESREGG